MMFKKKEIDYERLINSVESLPESRAGLQIDHGMYLELLDILVEANIISEELALKRYKVRLVRYGWIFNQGDRVSLGLDE